MSKKVAELKRLLEPGQEAEHIADMWTRYNDQRQEQIELWKEQRNYVFATDTSTTSNSELPWKNTTTLPKLCQIRDNLHANYLSALFPNDDWLKWEAYDSDSAVKEKARAIEAYMSNKTREGGIRELCSNLLLDFIDYGNVFVSSYFNNEVSTDEGGESVAQYIGPKGTRISPLDIVFNPTAPSFDDSWKIIRSIKTVGDLHQMSEDEPDNAYLQVALKRHQELAAQARNGTYSTEDWVKAEGFQMDGFGNLKEYYESNYVEILEFWGDFYNTANGEFKRNRILTVIDRAVVIRDVEMPQYMKSAPIRHVGWRARPDNLWHMGPLENLVGMQYRIDHLENLKSDALDLAVEPPLVISGEVEQFSYGPRSEIHIDENGSVTELGKNLQGVIQADNEISMLEQRMELYAGAPREAMGVRTAGEKTAFEVQQLQNAAGRIFQEKITSFEINLLEPMLNDMLECAVRNLNAPDVVRVINDDLGVAEFLSITKEDITATGKVRPIGARHFAAQSQMVQNLTQIFNTPLGQMVMPHTSGKRMSKLIEDVLGLSRHSLFEDNIAIAEQKESQSMANQAQEDIISESNVPLEGAQ